jgi:hypothetical protein
MYLLDNIWMASSFSAASMDFQAYQCLPPLMHAIARYLSIFISALVGTFRRYAMC